MHWIHSATFTWTWHQLEAGIYDGPQIKQLITDPLHQWIKLNHVPGLHLFLWEGKKLCTISGGYVLSFQQAWLTSATVHYLVCDICSVSQKLDLTGKNWCHVWNHQQQQQFRIRNRSNIWGTKMYTDQCNSRKIPMKNTHALNDFLCLCTANEVRTICHCRVFSKRKKKSHWQCKHFNSKRLP